MYRLFKFTHQTSVRVSQPATFDRVRQMHRKNLVAVLKHCRNASYSVGSRHPLVRMLKALSVDHTLPLLEYQRQVKNRLKMVTRRFKLTQADARGDAQEHGEFYGPNVVELWVRIDTDVDVLNLEKNWRGLQPIQVFRHPQKDLSLDLPKGERTDLSGTAVIGFDLEALALQYWAWMQEQKQSERDYLRNPQHYMHEYALPNMMLTHLNVVWLNRFYALLMGDRIPPSQDRWPIMILPTDDMSDKYLMDRISQLTRGARRYQEYFANIAMPIYDQSAWDTAEFPYGLLTRQNRWAWIIASLDRLKTLIQLDRMNGSARNYMEESTLRKEFRELRYDNALSYALPPGMEFDVDLEIRDQILRYI